MLPEDLLISVLPREGEDRERSGAQLHQRVYKAVRPSGDACRDGWPWLNPANTSSEEEAGDADSEEKVVRCAEMSEVSK